MGCKELKGLFFLQKGLLKYNLQTLSCTCMKGIISWGLTCIYLWNYQHKTVGIIPQSFLVPLFNFSLLPVSLSTYLLPGNHGSNYRLVTFSRICAIFSVLLSLDWIQPTTSTGDKAWPDSQSSASSSWAASCQGSARASQSESPMVPMESGGPSYQR